MSLLTNEQIAELVGIASNQSTSKDLYEEFHDWNEKKTSELLDALKETREHLDYISEWDMPIITKPVIDRCIAILEK
jgi:hypothetical protein